MSDIVMSVEEFETIAAALEFNGDPADSSTIEELMRLEGRAMAAIHRVRSRAGLSEPLPFSEADQTS